MAHAEIIATQNAMLSNHEKRDSLAKELMADLGNGKTPGISIDRLVDFAHEVIKLNAEFEILLARHDYQMAEARSLAKK
jgi:hypothetical protein